MSSLTREVRIIQNPALGAALIWQFVAGYSAASKISAPVPLPLTFLVLPIIFHEDTLEVVRRTQLATGLYAFADKFSRHENMQADLLLAIHSRVIALRSLSWRSVQIAVERRLLTLVPKQAEVIALSTSPASGVPSTIRPLVENANKLGVWCSQLSLIEICSVLKVQL